WSWRDSQLVGRHRSQPVNLARRRPADAGARPGAAAGREIRPVGRGNEPASCPNPAESRRRPHTERRDPATAGQVGYAMAGSTRVCLLALPLVAQLACTNAAVDKA